MDFVLKVKYAAERIAWLLHCNCIILRLEFRYEKAGKLIPRRCLFQHTRTLNIMGS